MIAKLAPALLILSVMAVADDAVPFDRIKEVDLIEEIVLRLDSASLLQLQAVSRDLHTMLSASVTDHLLFHSIFRTFRQNLQLSHLIRRLLSRRLESTVLRDLLQKITLQDAATVFDRFMTTSSDLSYSEKADLIKQLFSTNDIVIRELISGLLCWSLPQSEFDRRCAGLSNDEAVDQLYLSPIRASSPIFRDLQLSWPVHDRALSSRSIIDWMKENEIAGLLADPNIFAALLRCGVRFDCGRALLATPMSDDQIRAVFPLLNWIDGPGLSQTLIDALLWSLKDDHGSVAASVMNLPQVGQHLRDHYQKAARTMTSLAEILIIAFFYDRELFRLMANSRLEPDSPKTAIHLVLDQSNETELHDIFSGLMLILLAKDGENPNLGSYIDWTDEYLEELFRVASMTTISLLIDSDPDSFCSKLPQGRYEIDARAVEAIRFDTLRFVRRLHGIWTRYPNGYEKYLQDWDLFIAEPADCYEPLPDPAW